MILGAGSCLAQDMHFSQFQDHHALINPALTASKGEFQALMAYKNQWKKVAGAPYRSFGFSYETKVLSGGWRKQDLLPRRYRKQDVGRLGAGLSIYRDKAGEGDMGLTQINLSLASYIPTGHWSFLSVGLQGSMAFRRIDQTTLIYPNQYAPGGYDVSLNSFEEVPLDRYRYFDFGTGALWSYGYTARNFVGSRTTKARFGASAFHITQPNLRVIGRAEEKLYMKMVVHGDMQLPIRNTYLALAPAFLVQLQGPSKEILAGTMVKYFLSQSTHFTGNIASSCVNFGLYYRTGDAVIAQFLLEYEEQFAFGFSYDYTISSLKQANRLRGGPEFMFRMTPQENFLYQRR